MTLPPLGNPYHIVSVFIDFPSNSRGDAPFHCMACDYSRADWVSLHDHLGDVPWENIFKLSAFSAASELCGCVQIGIDVYTSHFKYQSKPYLYPWFSAAFAAAILHTNHFLGFCAQNKSSKSKVKFRQASNRCRRLLETAKLAYGNKTKDSITSKKLGSWDFWGIANSVLNKVKSALPSLFNHSVVSYI